MTGRLNTDCPSGDATVLQAELKERASHWRRSRFRMHLWEFTVSLSYALKRFLDLSVSSFVLLFGFPFLLFIAVLVKLSSRGPSLFVQTRVGYKGRHFLFYKFRSMVVNGGKKQSKEENHPSNENAEVREVKVAVSDDPQGTLQRDGAVLQKIRRYACVLRARPDTIIRTKVNPNDPNITRIGRFLRKTSLDELPQLFNVLLGDMSLVGPRPPVPSEVRKYSLDDRKRLNVKPGLTCLWQIKGRSNLSFEKQLQLDKEYIQSQSFFQDILILLKTVPAIIIGRGAY